MPPRKETELYAPVKAFLEAQGYAVKGEVKGCDMVAMREDEMVVVELKAAFNLALLLQGVDRQKVTESVYLAVEAPGPRSSGPRWSEIRHLCRRLGLGLMTVRFMQKGPQVEVHCDPEVYTPRKSPKKRTGLVREFARRTGDYNTGGSTQRPIVTAYREEALRIAAYLRQCGEAKVKAIRLEADSPLAAAILQKNYYGWFERVSMGVYRLTPQGEEALQRYADVVAD